MAFGLSIKARREGIDTGYATAGLLISSMMAAFVLMLLGFGFVISVCL